MVQDLAVQTTVKGEGAAEASSARKVTEKAFVQGDLANCLLSLGFMNAQQAQAAMLAVSAFMGARSEPDVKSGPKPPPPPTLPSSAVGSKDVSMAALPPVPQDGDGLEKGDTDEKPSKLQKQTTGVAGVAVVAEKSP